MGAHEACGIAKDAVEHFVENMLARFSIHSTATARRTGYQHSKGMRPSNGYTPKRVVQQIQVRLCVRSTCQADALLLATRQVDATLACTQPPGSLAHTLRQQPRCVALRTDIRQVTMRKHLEISG